MEPSPLVSIIIPTYNRAAFLLETIESVRNQTYSNWELIIVDDGSTDNTEEIVKAIRDSRITFYKAGRIGIGGRIKNIGINASKGSLIAFLDSDDCWAPTKLEKQIKLLQEYPDAGFSLTGGYTFRKSGEPLAYFYKQNEGIRYDDIFISMFSSEIAGYTQALMLRRSCLEKTGGFPEKKSFSDIDFIINLSRYFKAIITYEPLVYRRIHEENYIHANWEKSYFEGLEIIHNYKRNRLLPLKTARAALFRVHCNFGEKYLLYHQPWSAIPEFLKAWTQKPFSIIPFKKIGKAILQSFKKNSIDELNPK